MHCTMHGDFVTSLDALIPKRDPIEIRSVWRFADTNPFTYTRFLGLHAGHAVGQYVGKYGFEANARHTMKIPLDVRHSTTTHIHIAELVYNDMWTWN